MKHRLVLAMVGCLAWLACALVLSEGSQAATWPQTGKTMTIIVPFPAGGTTDILGRLMAAELQTILKIPVQVQNKPGASTQIAATAVVMSTPDGYTLGQFSIPTVFATYLDPSRKAIYTRKDLTMIGEQVDDAGILAVRADSPFKTVKDLVEAAKVRPDTVKVADNTNLGITHFILLQLQKVANIRLARVQFDGSAPATNAVLGGHVDAQLGGSLGDVSSQVDAGKTRVLGITGRARSAFLPNVPTFEEQGYPVFWSAARIYAVRSETPAEIVKTIRSAFEKAMESEEMKSRMKTLRTQHNFLNGDQAAKHWSDAEDAAAPLIKAVLEGR